MRRSRSTNRPPGTSVAAALAITSSNRGSSESAKVENAASTRAGKSKSGARARMSSPLSQPLAATRWRSLSFVQHICAEIDAEQTSGRADPLLYQSEVEPGDADDLHDGRAAPQLQRCNGATPVRPPSEADQVIGIHRPVVEARP